MPQASRELRDRIIQRFGDIDIPKPLDFLIERGYTEQDGLIRCPKNHVAQVDEIECINFLMHEWDFDYEGGEDQ